MLVGALHESTGRVLAVFGQGRLCWTLSEEQDLAVELEQKRGVFGGPGSV